MIIKFSSHLNQSLSKLKSTKFAPPLCSPSQAVSQQQFTSVVLKKSACVYFCSLHLLHRSSTPCEQKEKEIKLKFILQIGFAVLLFGMFFL